jgi:HlyD family secretion protein
VEIEVKAVPLAARAILVLLVSFLAIGVIWASLARLDRIVTAQGKLVTKAPHILIQPLETMIVRSVEVHVGQVVKAGELLARLDPTFAEADASATKGSLSSISAEANRLRAELGLAAPGRFSEDDREDLLQHQAFDDHARERASQLRSLDEDIKELTTHQQSLHQQRDALQREMSILRELAGMRQDLFDKGHGTKVTLLETQHQLAGSEREAGRLSNEETETEHRLSAAVAKRESQIGEWRSKDMHDLVDAQREQFKLAEEAKKRERSRKLVELVAPAHAVILDVVTVAPGSVIRQADTLMTLVPLDGPIEAEVKVVPSDISHLRPGDNARVKLDALPFQKHGTVNGKVTTISEDIFEEEQGTGHKAPVYRIRLAVDPSPLKFIPSDFRLIPGMTVTAEIKIGTRSLISYFLYPILQNLDSGLREP